MHTISKSDEFALYGELSQMMTLELYKKLTLLKNGSNDELIEELKTKYLGRFIDRGISITSSVSQATSTQGLFDELEIFLNEQGITLYSYDNGKFYHPDCLSWFPSTEVHQTTPTFQIPGLPKDGMTENEMIAGANELSMEYKHWQDEIIRAIKPMFEHGTLKKGDKDKYFIAMLKDIYGKDACEARFGFSGDGKFYFNVRRVHGDNGWNAFAFLLSQQQS